VVKREEAEHAGIVGYPWPPDGSKANILSVDDNPANPVLLRTPDRGLEAGRCGTAGEFVVMLFDVLMPGMGGYEVAHCVRETPGAKDTLIVAATEWGQNEDRRRSKEAGFDHHLVKSVDAAELSRLMAERKS
jgi:CheY-like chemotaxis protein